MGIKDLTTMGESQVDIKNEIRQRMDKLVEELPDFCFQCGKCCKDITFFVTERQIAIRHANYRGVDPKIIQRFRRSLEYIKSDGFEQREHYFLPGPCPFFCEAEGCLIYLSRPYACRNFLCGRTDEKEELEWEGRSCVNQMNRIREDWGYRKFVEQNLKKGREYAMSIGII